MVKQLIAVVAIIAVSRAMVQTRWEYGRLCFSDAGATWSTTESGMVRGITFEEFYTALTGVAAPDVQDHNVVILDLLGSWGWELVAKDELIYTFKRPSLLKSLGERIGRTPKLSRRWRVEGSSEGSYDCMHVVSAVASYISAIRGGHDEESCS